jgi:hypothetical protein
MLENANLALVRILEVQCTRALISVFTPSTIVHVPAAEGILCLTGVADGAEDRAGEEEEERRGGGRGGGGEREREREKFIDNQIDD